MRHARSKPLIALLLLASCALMCPRDEGMSDLPESLISEGKAVMNTQHGNQH
jgi:hypothetical protein